ncbi:MAG: polyphosphate kinase 1 [Aureliella sp.]
MTINPEHYFNRELSWLEFNQRVLDQATNPRVPLLERLKFLSITASNLDEFFMVRVGGLKMQHARGVASTDTAGMSVAAQLEAICNRTSRMVQSQYDCFLNVIEPGLAEHGITRSKMSEASVRHREAATRIFEDEIYPVLSPMSIDDEHEFPLLVNLMLHVCVELAAPKQDPPRRFAVIPLGRVLPRIITLPAERGFSFALLEDVVAWLAERFFPKEKLISAVPFRITRNADVDLQEDSASDLMRDMEEALAQRRTGQCVRLEIGVDAPAEMLEFLRKSLGLAPQDVVQAAGPLDLSTFMQMQSLEGYDQLRDPIWVPQRSPLVDPTQSMFATLAERDLLLCHPFESFEPVVRLIEEAADDPDVLSIKQTLYRTSRKSPIVAALCRAAERGKYVTAVVELKARFDEARNIEWARELEEAQVQVIYGVKKLKTHAKLCIIVRREPRGIVRYVHFGTGNYNEATSRLYSDVSYMTCNEELGRDASAFLNAVTGYSQPQQYRLIDAAPIGLRKKMLTLIDGETRRKKQGQRAMIVVKLNSLVDPALIEALYAASQAGVTVRLNIRGICCLRPGVPGLSENITVVSIVDRFLEHARVLYFYHGGDELVYISSADWMPRNLDRRIELLVPIEDAPSRRRLVGLLESYFRDNQNSWILQSDGSYRRREPDDGHAPFRCQEAAHRQAVETLKQAEQSRRTIFQTHQPAAKGQ